MAAPGAPRDSRKGDTELPSRIVGSSGFAAELKQPGGAQGHVQVFFTKEGVPLVWQDVLRGFRDECRAMRQLFSDTLRQMPFDAFFWECAPVSGDSLEWRQFEFVALNAVCLAGASADGEPFSEHLERARGQMTAHVFPNLGGDSLLVAPAQAVENIRVYSHLASFCRGAPAEQQDALWREVGGALQRRLSGMGAHDSIWLNTEGSGVSWLHVRLDSRPKYYHHKPYQDSCYGMQLNPKRPRPPDTISSVQAQLPPASMTLDHHTERHSDSGS